MPSSGTGSGQSPPALATCYNLEALLTREPGGEHPDRRARYHSGAPPRQRSQGRGSDPPWLFPLGHGHHAVPPHPPSPLDEREPGHPCSPCHHACHPPLPWLTGELGFSPASTHRSTQMVCRTRPSLRASRPMSIYSEPALKRRGKDMLRLSFPLCFRL